MAGIGALTGGHPKSNESRKILSTAAAFGLIRMPRQIRRRFCEWEPNDRAKHAICDRTRTRRTPLSAQLARIGQLLCRRDWPRVRRLRDRGGEAQLRRVLKTCASNKEVLTHLFFWLSTRPLLGVCSHSARSLHCRSSAARVIHISGSEP
jgi:hypothetical protein